MRTPYRSSIKPARRYMPVWVALLLLALPLCAHAQTVTLSGKVIDEKDKPLPEAEIKITDTHKAEQKAATNGKGAFTLKQVRPGYYHLLVTAHGYDDYKDSLMLLDKDDWDLGSIKLSPTLHELDEVKIAAKVLAMVQKDDTTEYNSSAFKVNPDADGADLVRKMPGIDINNKTISAQGEVVVKIVVDGKPFFGSDPFAALKNLPADVISKVQVYNEKSDQEQFTGFHEGPTTKTINIVTKADKRNGSFGTVYAGAGSDNSSDDKYGAGATLNKFAGDTRITLTGQTNNVSTQNFTDPNNGNNSGGLFNTNAGGLNYTDKWGKKTDITGSYFINSTTSSSQREATKTYTIPADSGQVYNEAGSSNNTNTSHRASLRLTTAIDTMNSLILQSNLSATTGSNHSQLQGYTNQDAELLNQSTNNNNSTNKSLSLSGSLLLRHKFAKKRRTLSVNLSGGDNGTNSDLLHAAVNTYYTSPTLDDTLNQQSLQKQRNLNYTGNAVYTEPVGSKGMAKAEYNINYMPGSSNKGTNDFSAVTNSYSLPDTLYSNVFNSRNIAHKAGGSYQYSAEKYDISFGLYDQLTILSNAQTLPYQSNVYHQYNNVLPVASLHYKLSKTKNLQLNYSANTQAPSVSQLQQVVNNTDPLHLYTGNPSLRQTFSHNLVARYNAVNADAKSSFSASLSGTYTMHSIVTNSVLAQNDTVIDHIVLARGGQFSMPENINGNSNINANANYGLPLTGIKCRINISINTSYGRSASVINNTINYQQNTNGGGGANLTSNINENIDFLVSGNANVVSTTNSVSTLASTTYFNETNRASLNLIFWKGFVFNTSVIYQYNTGLSAGYNQNYALWNMSIGKKIFNNHLGDIRLSAFDLLNKNNSIQHTVTDTYIQDSRSNVVQRYFLLVFNYKIRSFKKAKEGV